MPKHNLSLQCLTMDNNGKFIVSLPFKQESSVLGDLSCMASKRFFILERKLMIDENLAKHYNEYMSEHLSLEHIELVTHTVESEKSYFYRIML